MTWLYWTILGLAGGVLVIGWLIDDAERWIDEPAKRSRLVGPVMRMLIREDKP